MHVCLCVHTCHLTHVELRRQLAGVLSSHHVGSRDQSQAVTPCTQSLYPPNRRTSPGMIISAISQIADKPASPFLLLTVTVDISQSP